MSSALSSCRPPTPLHFILELLWTSACFPWDADMPCECEDVKLQTFKHDCLELWRRWERLWMQLDFRSPPYFMARANSHVLHRRWYGSISSCQRRGKIRSVDQRKLKAKNFYTGYVYVHSISVLVGIVKISPIHDRNSNPSCTETYKNRICWVHGSTCPGVCAVGARGGKDEPTNKWMDSSGLSGH